MTTPTPPAVPGHDITPIPAPQGHPSPNWWQCSCGKQLSDQELLDRHLAETREFAGWVASLRDLTLPQLLDEYGTALHRHTTHGRNGTYRDKVYGREQSEALRAEIDRRLAAAPSGETAPRRAVAMSWDWREQPNLNELGLRIDALTNGGIQVYEVDTDSDQYGIVVADVELSADQVAETYERATVPGAPPVVEVPAGGEVATASVPARTNAQATPASLMDLIEQYATARVREALTGEYGNLVESSRRAREADRLLDQIRTALAAPSGEQPTTLDDQVDAIRREVYDNVYVNDDDGYPWLTCGLCGKRLVEMEAGIEWPDLDRKVTGHDCAKPADQSGTEPVGEVPDHG